MHPRHILVFLGAVLCAGLCTSVLSAAGGALDPTFGSSGKVTTDFGGSETASSVALQRDGRIVVVGNRFDPGPADDFVVSRYTDRGALDSSFDGDGKLTTDFGGHFDGAFDVAVQGDGKILAAGYGFAPTGPQDFALARYNPDGTLDQTFGAGGKVLTSFRSNSIDAAFSLVIQPDGKIVAGGRTRSTTTDDFGLARYLPNGALDPSFGAGGLVTTSLTTAHDDVLDLALQRDGKIVAAGASFDPVDRARTEIELARYNSDGQLDASFDTDGLVIAPFPPYSTASDVAIQPDGKIVTAGAIVARFNPDGSVDRTFGDGGQAHVSATSATALSVQSDGKLLVVGTRTGPASTDIGVGRLTVAGRPDANFGPGGTVTTDIRSGSEDYATAGVLGGGGKLVVAGATRSTPGSGPWDFAVARYVAIRSCVVPNVRGRTVRSARTRLTRANCQFGKVGLTYSRKVKKGRVISQQPRAGARLSELQKVNLVVSRGRR
jgi:uncharacterized delta-60 repeat protein